MVLMETKPVQLIDLRGTGLFKGLAYPYCEGLTRKNLIDDAYENYCQTQLKGAQSMKEPFYMFHKFGEMLGDLEIINPEGVKMSPSATIYLHANAPASGNRFVKGEATFLLLLLSSSVVKFDSNLTELAREFPEDQEKFFLAGISVGMLKYFRTIPEAQCLAFLDALTSSIIYHPEDWKLVNIAADRGPKMDPVAYFKKWSERV